MYVQTGEWHQRHDWWQGRQKHKGNSDIKQEVTQHGGLIPRRLLWCFSCRMRVVTGQDGPFSIITGGFILFWSLLLPDHCGNSSSLHACPPGAGMCKTSPAHPWVLTTWLGGEKKQPAPSRPQAGLRSRPAHLFLYHLELALKQLVARYFDLLPEDFVHVFSCNPPALLPFYSQSTSHTLTQRKKKYFPDLSSDVQTLQGTSWWIWENDAGTRFSTPKDCLVGQDW